MKQNRVNPASQRTGGSQVEQFSPELFRLGRAVRKLTRFCFDDDDRSLPGLRTYANQRGSVHPRMLVEDRLAADGEEVALVEVDRMLPVASRPLHLAEPRWFRGCPSLRHRLHDVSLAATHPQTPRRIEVPHVSDAMPERLAVCDLGESRGFRTVEVLARDRGAADDNLADV